MMSHLLTTDVGCVGYSDTTGVDVSLEVAFTGAHDTATLELNSGETYGLAHAELTRDDARILRDALDRLLGETGRVLPPF